MVAVNEDDVDWAAPRTARLITSHSHPLDAGAGDARHCSPRHYPGHVDPEQPSCRIRVNESENAAGLHGRPELNCGPTFGNADLNDARGALSVPTKKGSLRLRVFGDRSSQPESSEDRLLSRSAVEGWAEVWSLYRLTSRPL